VGINAYPSSPLQGCISDITAVRDKLVNSYGWSLANIHFVTDAAATPQKITQELQWLASVADSSSQTVFSFSGHGSSHTIYAYPMDGVSDASLATEFKKLRSQENVVILDSCYSGANTAVNITAPPFVSMMACAADETASDGNTFTKAWVEGLGTTQYGEVEDAFPYAYNKIQSWQHPIMWDNIAGKVMLGRRPPAIVGTVPDMSAPEDTPVSVTLTANESDPVDGHAQLNWSVDLWNGTHIANIIGQRSANDTLTFFPARNWNGKTVVSLTLTNSAGRTARQNISITWTPVNDLPAVTSFDKLWPTVERMKGVKAIVYGHDVDDSDSTLGAEVEYRPAGGIWTPAGGSISYVTNHWELMLVPNASCPLGTADIRARLRDDEGWSGWTATSGFIWILNSPPAVTALTASAGEVHRARNLTLTVKGQDPENAREKLVCELEVKPANETSWIRIFSVPLAQDGWTAIFRPMARAALGSYDARARLRDADSTFSDWKERYGLFVVQNALPVLGSLELSADNTERGKPVTVTVRGFDVEDPIGLLVCDIHFKGPSGAWARLENVTAREDRWEARFLPLSYFKPGEYSFRVVLKDSAGQMSDWLYQNGSLEVANSLPTVDSINFSRATLLRSQNITLQIHGGDYEDRSSNLSCEVEYCAGAGDSGPWSGACIRDLHYDDRLSCWSCVFDAPTGIAAGSYTFRARLRDRDGDWGEWHSPTQNVKLQNNPPIARIAPFQLVVNENASAVFDGSASTDAEGPLEFLWDFGDGTSGEGEQATHVYLQGGPREIVLTVTDQDGDKSQARLRTRVNLLPVARASCEQMPGADDLGVRFDASSSTDAEGAVVSYIWDFDSSVDSDMDGKPDNDRDSSSAYPKFDYGKEGIYTAKLTVVDADNGSSSIVLAVKVTGSVPGDDATLYIVLTIVVAVAAAAGVAAASRNRNGRTPPLQLTR
jgi:hypothetical protein